MPGHCSANKVHFYAGGDAAAAAAAAAEARALFARSDETYQLACGCLDTESGDDLAGLLYDWGCTLHAFAENAQCVVASITTDQTCHDNLEFDKLELGALLPT